MKSNRQKQRFCHPKMADLKAWSHGVRKANCMKRLSFIKLCRVCENQTWFNLIFADLLQFVIITCMKLVDKNSWKSTCIKPVDNLQQTCYHQAISTFFTLYVFHCVWSRAINDQPDERLTQILTAFVFFLANRKLFSYTAWRSRFYHYIVCFCFGFPGGTNGR